MNRFFKYFGKAHDGWTRCRELGNKRYNFFNENGELFSETGFGWISDFNEGIAMVLDESENKRQFKLINLDGKEVKKISIYAPFAEKFECGWIPVMEYVDIDARSMDDCFYNFYNNRGERMFEDSYEVCEINEFDPVTRKAKIRMRADNKYYLVDEFGKISPI